MQWAIADGLEDAHKYAPVVYAITKLIIQGENASSDLVPSQIYHLKENTENFVPQRILHTPGCVS